MGPFAILSGAELVKWKSLEEKWSLVDAWKIEHWRDELGFTYHSLEHTQTTLHLDRVYLLHNVDWVPCSLKMEILTRGSLFAHSTLACILAFSKDEFYKPKRRAKLVVANDVLFKDTQFKELVSRATKELEAHISQE